MGPSRLGEGILGILLIGSIHPPLVIDLTLAVTGAICSAQELCAGTQGELAHLSSPCFSLHRTHSSGPFPPKVLLGTSTWSQQGFLSSPRSPPASSPAPWCCLFTFTRKPRNACGTCSYSHLPHFPFWLPDCLSLAPGLSRLEGNCSDSQLCMSLLPPCPLLFPSKDGLAKKAEASAKIKGLLEQHSGVSVSSHSSAQPGFHLC